MVLSRSFTLTVAFVWLAIGFDSEHIGYFHPVIWPVITAAIAAGIVHTTFRPDRRKLRLITALSVAASILRAGAIAAEDAKAVAPAAAWLLISMLSVAYYLARRDNLPEEYGDDLYS